MVLPNAVLLPQALLPLHIFEPRYRTMLAQALEGSRMFAIALPRSNGEPRSMAGIGLIRVCVERDNGTSDLILQGMARVRLRSHRQTDPYFVEAIELAPTEGQNDAEVAPLAQRILNHVNGLQNDGKIEARGIVDFLNQLTDYDALADIVAYSFVVDPQIRQLVLETVHLPDRFRRIDSALAEMRGTEQN